MSYLGPARTGTKMIDLLKSFFVGVAIMGFFIFPMLAYFSIAKPIFLILTIIYYVPLLIGLITLVGATLRDDYRR